MNVTTEQLNDGMVKVTVEQDGILATGFVSSFHLVDPKAKQLKEVISLMAVRSYNPINTTHTS